ACGRGRGARHRGQKDDEDDDRAHPHFLPVRLSKRNHARAVAERRSAVYRVDMATLRDSFGSRGTLRVGGSGFVIYRLGRPGASARRLPVSLRVLLENLLRLEDGRRVQREHIEAVLAWDPSRAPTREIPFMPARVLLQDFTGVPAVVDLA